MSSVRASVLVSAACAALAVPALAAAQFTVPTSGTATGFDWTTFPLGPTDSPSAIASAFGLLWVADGSTYAFPLGFGVTRITPTPAPAPAA